MTKITKLDIAEYLKTEEDIQVFLDEAMATGNSKEFIHALNTAARAKGIPEIAEKSGRIKAPGLYK